jgi:hypothetical protein
MFECFSFSFKTKKQNSNFHFLVVDSAISMRCLDYNRKASFLPNTRIKFLIFFKLFTFSGDGQRSFQQQPFTLGTGNEFPLMSKTFEKV